MMPIIRKLIIIQLFLVSVIEIEAQTYIELTTYPIEIPDSCKPETIKLDTVFYPYTKSDSRLFIQTEQLPEFPGGDKALADFFRSNVNYPDSAIKALIEGPVKLIFSINSAGCVDNFKFFKILHFGIDIECVRVLKCLPKFKPGIQLTNAKKGMYWRPATFWYTIPLYFTLVNDESHQGIIIKPKVF